MATPYSGISGGTKDAYNFYHSQLRINIECTFGRFVHRWAMLRGAIPMNITLAKTTAMIVAMAKLHNFCIDQGDNASQPTAVDTQHIVLNGAVPLDRSDEADMDLPIDLMYGGHHFDDMAHSVRQQRQREGRASTAELPREKLHKDIASKGLKRPAPTRNRH